MQLYYQNRCLGWVDGVFLDQPEVHGRFSPAAGIEPFEDLFAWLVNEDNAGEEPPFDDALLDEANWFVVDNDGRKRGISVPGVYDDGEIFWRWRP